MLIRELKEGKQRTQNNNPTPYNTRLLLPDNPYVRTRRITETKNQIFVPNYEQLLTMSDANADQERPYITAGKLEFLKVASSSRTC
jgi:hypothetical protein